MSVMMNMSGLYADEGRIAAGDSRCCDTGAEVLDLTGLEGTCCYCATDALEAIRAAIAPFSAHGLHWIDSGDYHYLSLLWMEKITVPFGLLLFDNHPDDAPGAFDAGLLSCGNWVAQARRSLPLMKRDTRNCLPAPDGLPVYVSIDLDVLSRDFARTDWSQGDMSLDALLDILRQVAGTREVLGVDICGGITVAKGASAEDLTVNRHTAEALLSSGVFGEGFQ